METCLWDITPTLPAQKASERKWEVRQGITCPKDAIWKLHNDEITAYSCDEHLVHQAWEIEQYGAPVLLELLSHVQL